MAEASLAGEQLMQRAANHVASAAQRYLRNGKNHVLAICGAGNNGGDGIAAVRLLLKANPALCASVWLLNGNPSDDCERELARLQAEQPQALLMRIGNADATGTPTFLPIPSVPPDTTCILDALFGTGLSREVTGTAAELCRRMTLAKQRGIPVIAVDIPSGLHGESGQVLGMAVHATETVTFHRPKTGLFLGEGPNHAGKVTIGAIGIPAQCDDATGFWIAEKGDMGQFFPPRRPVTHKGSYGRVLVIAGSLGMAGAAAICATAALRTGAGLVTIACPESIISTLQMLCPCATCLPLPAQSAEAACALLSPALAKADAIAIGCGLGTDDYARALLDCVTEFLAKTNKPAVLDADALGMLATTSRELPRFSTHQILTPHPAEAARMLGISTAQVLADMPFAACSLAKRYGFAVVLKGATSVLIAGNRQGLNVLGTPALAKGGSGDALTGCLAALLANGAQGALSFTDFEVLQAGTALHGLAGMAAAQNFGERGVLATDVCGFLGRDFDSEATRNEYVRGCRI